MRKHASTIIVILMIVTGLSLLLYPTVSNYLSTRTHRRVISRYIANVEPIRGESYEELLAAAQAYNKRLTEKGEFVQILSKEEQAEYDSLLNTGNSGVMGYLSVPKVDIYLPIYHGTGDDALQRGAGHLEGSSLPVGGPGTHAVHSAHTGLPSAKLFTNIDRLTEGDTFTVQVLKETLTYQVDQIQIVLPTQADALRIEPEADYCTLLTCTPYGVNSHRLLVRGSRIPTPPSEEDASADAVGETLNGSPGETPADSGHWSRPVASLGLAAAAALTLVVFILRRRMWRRAKRLKK